MQNMHTASFGMLLVYIITDIFYNNYLYFDSKLLLYKQQRNVIVSVSMFVKTCVYNFTPICQLTQPNIRHFFFFFTKTLLSATQSVPIIAGTQKLFTYVS